MILIPIGVEVILVKHKELTAKRSVKKCSTFYIEDKIWRFRTIFRCKGTDLGCLCIRKGGNCLVIGMLPHEKQIN